MKTPAQIRALENIRRCDAAYCAAMNARDAIADCFSAEWRLAHATARTAAAARDNAFGHAYDVAALPKPYWA